MRVCPCCSLRRANWIEVVAVVLVVLAILAVFEYDRPEPQPLPPAQGVTHG